MPEGDGSLSALVKRLRSLGLPSLSVLIARFGDVEDYQERVDPEGFMNKTEPEAAETFTFVGAAYSALSVVWDLIRFTIGGFPTMMIAISGQVPAGGARTAFNAVAGILIAVTYLIMSLWLFELWSGRKVE